jgi:hypothetical protein
MFEGSKFQNCPSETEILHSYFEIPNCESESQQSTSQMNESEQNWMILAKNCQFRGILLTFVKSNNYSLNSAKA